MRLFRSRFIIPLFRPLFQGKVFAKTTEKRHWKHFATLIGSYLYYNKPFLQFPYHISSITISFFHMKTFHKRTKKISKFIFTKND